MLKRFYFILFFLVSFFFLAVVPAFAQTDKQKYVWKVQTQVEVDGSIKYDIIRSLNSALRDIKDVMLVDSMPGYIILVVAVKVIEIENQSSIALSCTVFEPDTLPLLRWYLKKCSIKKQEVDYAMSLYSDLVHYRGGWIYYFPSSQLEEYCKKIANWFDVEILEPGRKSNDKFDEMFPGK